VQITAELAGKFPATVVGRKSGRITTVAAAQSDSAIHRVISSSVTWPIATDSTMPTVKAILVHVAHD
jgi:hypothetical protein